MGFISQHRFMYQNFLFFYLFSKLHCYAAQKNPLKYLNMFFYAILHSATKLRRLRIFRLLRFSCMLIFSNIHFRAQAGVTFKIIN